jgi:endonuclease G
MPYNKNFIPGKTVELPTIPARLKNKVAPLLNGTGHVIDYLHHSVVINKERKLAFFAASNINGKSWEAIERKGSFKKDEKAILLNYQLGKELYDAIRGNGFSPNDFEQGHLASFQEVLWGTAAERKKAAADTFYYTNCVPQHERINSGLWRSLEQYVLKTETLQHGLKVNVLTGPLLLKNDPYYIEKVNGEYVKIPCVFWKIIYYPNNNGLNAVGFMMSHKQLLLKDGTVTYDKGKVKESRIKEVTEDLFMDYKYDDVYQVKVEFIQQQTGLRFMLKNVHLPYQSDEKKELLYKRIEVMRAEVLTIKSFAKQELDYMLSGITL